MSTEPSFELRVPKSEQKSRARAVEVSFDPAGPGDAGAPVAMMRELADSERAHDPAALFARRAGRGGEMDFGFQICDLRFLI